MGYEHIRTLSKTDVKWLVEILGNLSSISHLTASIHICELMQSLAAAGNS